MANTHLCRCCLSETCFKDISNEYYHDGLREVYSDMLFNTFNINISYQGDSTRLICEYCIVRLRDAAAFRTQVLRAEEILVKNLHRSSIHNTEPELLRLMDIKDDFLDHITGQFEDDEHEGGEEWHGEVLEPEDGGELILKIEPEDPVLLQATNCGTERLAGSMPVIKKVHQRVARQNPKTDKNKRKQPVFQRDRKENSLKLLNSSNICLFESLKTKFRCFYCKNAFLNIKDLREHSTTHSNPAYLKMCINRLQGMSYKTVDISNLTCKLCSETLTDLDELMTHLIENHNIEFSSREHLLIPYKLEDGFNCILCDEKYNTFFRLSIHMNTHYTNNVCEICGVSYINRLSLRMHVNSLHKEKKCSVCPATFTNTYTRIKHMRKVHNFKEAERHCLLCNKTFRYTYMLNEHKILEHGLKRTLSVCPECGKTFLTAVNLRTHVRSVHMRERNHHCSYCGLSFFTSCDRRRHERTHQDVRLFACSYCEGRFKSKDSLRRHLKRQHGNLVINQNDQV